MGARLEDLDPEEILRTRQTAIEQRRLSAGASMDMGDILDRLGLRVDGQVTQAAQMLYGTIPNARICARSRLRWDVVLRGRMGFGEPIG